MISIKQRWMNGTLTIVLAIWVIVIFAYRGRRLLQTSASSNVGDRAWESLTNRLPLLGSSAATFKIVEFSDYQCPYCASAESGLVGFAERHPADVALYRYDMPLEMHQYAYAASIAAHCAELQGVREPYQSLLFKHQKEFATVNWVALAKQAGVSSASSFERCIRDKIPSEAIRRDVEVGKSMGIESTPYILINGVALSNGFSLDKLESIYADTSRANRALWWRLF